MKAERPTSAGAAPRHGGAARLAAASGTRRPILPRIGYRLLRTLFPTPLYRWSLAGRRPNGLAVAPPAPWPGSAEQGRAILQGRYAFAGQTIGQTRNPWTAVGARPAWLATLHGFSWLGDLRALDEDAARRAARDLTRDWLDRHGSWSATAWRAHVIGTRLVAWLTHYDHFFANADAALQNRLMAALGRQLRHLRRVAAIEVDGAARLLAIKGLVYGGACLASERPGLPAALRLLEAEIARQVLPDGGHAERSPVVQLEVLRHFVEMRAVLAAAQEESPAALQNAIDRMAPALRFFRHGDGRLALFNGSCESETAYIDQVLRMADARGRAPARLPHLGFERLAAGRLLAITDTGAARPGLDEHAHAGTLSLEVCIGRERVIVNCGAVPGDDPTWRQAQRSTAAHSTVTIADTNSSPVRIDGRAPLGSGRRPLQVLADRDETEGNIWLYASHDGYLGRFGIVHRRRLFLSADGEDLRGEDTLDVADAKKMPPGGRDFAVRFHLHPGVRASIVQDGRAALLRLPSGAGWRLRAGGGRLALAESIYIAGPGDSRRTQQIVIAGNVGADGATAKWALQREPTTQQKLPETAGAADESTAQPTTQATD